MRLTARVAASLQMTVCIVHMLVAIAVVSLAVSLHCSLRPYSAFLYHFATLLPALVTTAACADLLVAAATHITLMQGRAAPLFYVTIIVAVLFCIKFVGIIIAYIFQSVFYDNIEISLNNMMFDYLENPVPVDDLQVKLTCCGEIDAGDWFNITGYIPKSCCPRRDPSVTVERCRIPADYFVLNPYGCLDRLEALLEHNIIIILLILLIADQITQALLFCTAFLGSAVLRIQERQNSIQETSGR